MPYSEETASYKLNHTMLRIKDPNISIPLYTDIIGMELIEKARLQRLYAVFPRSGGKATDSEKKEGLLSREGILELTHNHGTESLAMTPYHSGTTLQYDDHHTHGYFQGHLPCSSYGGDAH
ncbi:hypothetical protein BJV78DRAFT_1221429 [Lactifluus subvellereus]|nr:hypothetical protein BJV78DRAFT_1221429 [Lactifluus subvellereus]